jgi:type I restriction enzyme, S subunit
MNKTLEAIGQAIFKKWFVDEKKEEWEVSKIGKELKTILGGTPDRTKPEYWNGNINWINSGAINDFPIINPSEKISELGLNKSATQLMSEKTIVLPFVISVGKPVSISILGIETAGNQSVLGIVPNEKFSSSFVYYYIQNQKNEIYSSVTGGAQQHINKRNVDETEIIIPDKKTLENFNFITEKIIDLIIKNALQNQTLAQIRDVLLPKLMSGEVRVK